jgi:6-pyruvoyl-tetrahydropterin synthase
VLKDVDENVTVFSDVYKDKFTQPLGHGHNYKNKIMLQDKNNKYFSIFTSVNILYSKDIL